MISPRPLQQKPAFMFQSEGQRLSLNTECSTPDVYIYPSTPPLSVSGSATSSPPSTCGILHTPLAGPFFALENMEGVKEGCEEEVQSEILAGGDWTRCFSPPLTPGKLFCRSSASIETVGCKIRVSVWLILSVRQNRTSVLANGGGSIYPPTFGYG